jgi:hypothetical protein
LNSSATLTVYVTGDRRAHPDALVRQWPVLVAYELREHHGEEQPGGSATSGVQSI